MSMLTLNGLVQNVLNKPESKDKKTGEIRPATENFQILAENLLPGKAHATLAAASTISAGR